MQVERRRVPCGACKRVASWMYHVEIDAHFTIFCCNTGALLSFEDIMKARDRDGLDRLLEEREAQWRRAMSSE